MLELTETQFGDEVDWLPWRSQNTLRVAFIQIRIHQHSHDYKVYASVSVCFLS